MRLWSWTLLLKLDKSHTNPATPTPPREGYDPFSRPLFRKVPVAQNSRSIPYSFHYQPNIPQTRTRLLNSANRA